MTAGSWWTRTALLLAMVTVSSACIPRPLVPRGSGENVAFALFNNSGRVLHEARVHQVGSREHRWDAASVLDPVPEFRLHSPSFGGRQYYASGSGRVPEEAEVSWRELPPPGAPPYTGELKGPYKVAVRSRVPAVVLKQASKDGYMVELSFSVGQLPILFNWQLIAFGSVTGEGIKVLARGGDTFNGGGENVAFALFNNSGRVLQDVRVHRVGLPDFKWNDVFVLDPVPQSRLNSPSFGGLQYFGSRVPEEVEVSWRELPPPGGQSYTGERKGPYKVAVRSRVPPEVLKQAAKDGYRVELSISVGQLPILLNWRLVAFRSVTDEGEALKRGGDSFK